MTHPTHAQLIAEVRAAYALTQRKPHRGHYADRGARGLCPLTVLALAAGVTPSRPDYNPVGVQRWAANRFGRWFAAGISRGWDGLCEPADYFCRAIDRPEVPNTNSHYPGAGADYLAGHHAGVALAEAIYPFQVRES